MCKDDGTVNDIVGKAKKAVPKQLTPFTPDSAKEASKRAAVCRSLRSQARQKMLEAVLNEGIDKYIVRALKSMDPDQITVVEKAMKLVGLDFASSEESVQRTVTKVDSTVKSDNKLVITIEDADERKA